MLLAAINKYTKKYKLTNSNRTENKRSKTKHPEIKPLINP